MKWLGLLLLLNGFLRSPTIKAEEIRKPTFFISSLSMEKSLPLQEVGSKPIYFELDDLALNVVSPSRPKDSLVVKRKILAIGLAVTLGVFGVHRLYLGTAPKVPLIYTLTLGGGFGVLVVSDIIAILSSKKLDAFSPNENVFMWAK